MEHQISEIQVFRTREYGRFNILPGNRDLDDAKIRRIRQEIASGLNLLPYVPILCQEKRDQHGLERLDIYDGQNRYWTAKSLKLWVYYVLYPVDLKFELTDIPRMNANSEKWKSEDYIKCHVYNNNPHYITLDKFMSKYQLPLSTAMPLLAYGRLRQGGMESGARNAFKVGKFTVSAEKDAERIMDNVLQFNRYPFHLTRAFISAICTLMEEGIDLNILIKAFCRNPKGLTRAHACSEYVDMLTRLYTTGR